jgi:hypothetical protein
LKEPSVRSTRDNFEHNKRSRILLLHSRNPRPLSAKNSIRINFKVKKTETSSEEEEEEEEENKWL